MSTPTLTTPTSTHCTGRCPSQCDGCHSLENCVPAAVRHGDLLLCPGCYRVAESYARIGSPIPSFPLSDFH